MDLEFLKFGLIAAELWLLAGAFLILLAGMFAPTKHNLPSLLSSVFHLIAILWLVIYFPVQGEGFYGFIFARSFVNFRIPVLFLWGKFSFADSFFGICIE